MKRCPVCDSTFPDAEQFCELDGAQLVTDYAEYLDYRKARGSQNWKILTTVAVAGIAIGMVLFIVYQQMTREPNDLRPDESSNASVAQQMPLLNARPSPFASVSPSDEPSPSPSANPSPSAPADAARVTLSSSPVSTGGEAKFRSGTVKILLTNGTTVEADEVWETREGIWYRRRGVVTLLERDQVTAIDRASPPSSPSATPATSPSASP